MGLRFRRLPVVGALIAVILVQPFLGEAGFAEGLETTVRIIDDAGRPLSGIDVAVSTLNSNLTFDTDSSGKLSFQGVSGTGSLNVGFQSCRDAKSNVTVSSGKLDFGAGGKSLEVQLPTPSAIFKFSLIGEDGSTLKRPNNQTLIEAGRIPGLVITPSGTGMTLASTVGPLDYTVCKPIAWVGSQTLAVLSLNKTSGSGVISITKHITGGFQNLQTPFSALSTSGTSQINVGAYTHWTQLIVPNPAYIQGAIFSTSLSQGTKGGYPFPRYIGCDVPGSLLKSEDGVNYSQLVTVRSAGPKECRVYSAADESDSVTVTFVDGFAKVRGKAPKLSTCAQVNSIWPGGVAKNPQAIDVGPKAKFAPFFEPTYFAKLKTLDKDKDNIACER